MVGFLLAQSLLLIYDIYRGREKTKEHEVMILCRFFGKRIFFLILSIILITRYIEEEAIKLERSLNKKSKKLRVDI